jgi:beta-glucanase (GH16 family)
MNRDGAGEGSALHGGSWTLVWADEFDRDGPPDPAKWSFEVQPPGWVNDELENYTDRAENAHVEGGHLVIEARRDSYGGHTYSSARLHTAGKADLLYGRIEVRAKLPQGRGTWPAIWMMPTDNHYGWWPQSGELDIMEHVGHDPGVVHASAHTAKYYWKNNNQKTATIVVSDFATAYHLYSLEWYFDHVDAFVDDIKYFTFSDEHSGWEAWPFDQRFHVILNVAIGGVWGGAQGVDDAIFPQRMEIDYVRLYRAAP